MLTYQDLLGLTNYYHHTDPEVTIEFLDSEEMDNVLKSVLSYDVHDDETYAPFFYYLMLAHNDGRGYKVCDMNKDEKTKLFHQTINRLKFLYKEHRTIQILEENDIIICDNGEDYELESYTDYGGDMIFYVEKLNAECIQRYIDDFDINMEVAKLWCNGRRSDLPYSNIVDHYNDLEDWIGRLEEIVHELNKI